MVISSLIISLFDMLGKAFSHYRFNCGNYPELKTELLFLYDLYIINLALSHIKLENHSWFIMILGSH